ncbi:MAG: integrase family protein [Nocardioides sp.]|nr:integrase family protein [Nocardioides sp.]
MNGSVWRRDNGMWAYRFDIEPHPLTGQRRSRSKSGYPTKKDASAALRSAIGAHERGRSVKASRRSVAVFLNEWHAAVQPGLRPSTWTNYRDYLDAYVIPIIGDTVLQDLTPVRLNLLYGHLLEEGRVKRPGGLAPKTVQNVHRMLHRALRDAVKWDLIPRNYAEDAEPPRAHRTRPTIWTPLSSRKFVKSVRHDRFYALWLLVVTTGLRRGELAGLVKGDVDLELGRISPSQPRVVVDGRAIQSHAKTRSGERSLALDPDTLDALNDYLIAWEEERALLGQDTGLLFVWPDGRPLHPDTITALFHKHCVAAGLPRIRLHDVRHSYATAALKAGISPKIISERLGHSTAAFTLQTYTHVIPGMDEAAANAVAALILAEDQPENASGIAVVHNEDREGQEMQSAPGNPGADVGSGGRI